MLPSMGTRATQREIALFLWWDRSAFTASPHDLERFAHQMGSTTIEYLLREVPPTLSALRLAGGDKVSLRQVTYLRPHFPYHCDAQMWGIPQEPLLKDPQLLLDGSAPVLSKHPDDLRALWAACQKADQLYALYMEIISHPRQYYVQEIDRHQKPMLCFPPLLLSECGCDGPNSAKINRLLSPRRERMECAARDHILKCVPDRSSVVRIIDVGCGNLLPLWRILGLLLMQGYRTFHVGLVDLWKPNGYHEEADLIEALHAFFQKFDGVTVQLLYSPTVPHFFRQHPEFSPHLMLAMDFDQFHATYSWSDLPESAQRIIREETPSLVQDFGGSALSDLILCSQRVDGEGAFILGFGQHDYVFDFKGKIPTILHSDRPGKAIGPILKQAFPAGATRAIRMAVFNDLLPALIDAIVYFARSGVERIEILLAPESVDTIPGEIFHQFLSQNFPQITFAPYREIDFTEELERDCYAPAKRVDVVLHHVDHLRTIESLRRAYKTRGAQRAHVAGKGVLTLGISLERVVSLTIPD